MNTIQTMIMQWKSLRGYHRIRLLFLILLVGLPFEATHAQVQTRAKINKQAISPGEPQVHIRIKWKVPPRLEKSWAAWNGRSYNSDYLYPHSWPVIFDLCSSIGLNPSIHITEYDFEIQGISTKYIHNSQSLDCHRNIRVPKLGRYKITVRARTQEGWSRPYSKIIEVKDWLIAIIGDSMFSGEGNPDQPGEYDASIDWFNENPFDWLDASAWVPSYEVTGVDRPAKWKDLRCHRSALSGPVLAAKELEEKDSHSSITLIDLACSGAEIFTGLLEPYEGITHGHPRGSWYNDINDIVGRPQVVDHRDLPPQIKLLENLVGTNSKRGGRGIDALLMSIGVNDLHFSSVIEDCARNVNPQGLDCISKFHTFENIAKLEDSYRVLADRLEQELDIAEVYIAQYPPDPIGTEGCGWLDYPAPGVSVSKNEARAINGAGNALNGVIRKAAREYGWNYLEGIIEAFHSHAYCDDPTFFVGITESLKAQGIQHGALHPNQAGQNVFKEALLDAIVLRPQVPHKKVTITITQIMIKEESMNGITVGTAKSGQQIKRYKSNIKQSKRILFKKSREKNIANDTTRSIKRKSDQMLADTAGNDQTGQSRSNLGVIKLIDDKVPSNPVPSGNNCNCLNLELQFISNQYNIWWPENLGETHSYTIQESQYGQWIKLPAPEFTYTFNVYPAPASPRHPIGVGFIAGTPAASHILTPFHTAENNYGEGSNQISKGNVNIRYTIKVENIDKSLFEAKKLHQIKFKIQQ